ncbi:MAG: bifunctional UDP-N-acetylmuramoyl-tripeptide:D-alanyl-D-alanine ligase/alanine racemase [Muribaculaceae bacterium]|nr:bifunctional UDP-N-acetylmuramoyl-tripeptide:D-alanyl-D-alanine ligase/alanine racemase [Muribaculaceae bacterium]
MQLSFAEIRNLLGVEPISKTGASDADAAIINSLLTDSRSLSNPASTIFFAIETPTNSGLRYVRELYDKGVRYFVVPSQLKNPAPADLNLDNLADELPEAVFLPVEDPILALQSIAGRKGGRGGEIVGITGSKGKTTIKEWIFQLLEPIREIARSPRSYNSQIGVPLSMWGITDATDLTLIEAGVSKEGEMKRLADCILPDTVIVTDIIQDSDSDFPSHEVKIEEKISLAAGETVRKVIFCKDDPSIAPYIERLPKGKQLISWSENDSEATLYIKQLLPDLTQPEDWTILSYSWLRGPERHIRIPLTEKSDLRNACAVLAFMLSEGLPDEIIQRRFACLHPIDTRLSVSDGGHGVNVVYDSYTSDITSLIPAVDFIKRRQVPGQRAIVVLSDLRHEAGAEKDDYRRIAEIIRRRDIDLFVGVGPKLSAHADLFRPSDLFYPDTLSLLKELRSNPTSDAVVLLKGAPEFDFINVKEVLEDRTHETVLEVNLDAMIKNYNYFKSHLPASTGMIAMVKASGYGAGSYEIAKTLQDAGAAYLAVAVLDEGIALRRRGITMPIMVMNPRVADYREMFTNLLQPEIYTLGMLRDVITQAKRYGVTDYPIHIKLDTGMHRMGFIEEELPQVLEVLRGQNRVKISSVFSHLATADCPDMDDYTEMQLATFERASSYLLDNCGYRFKRHVLNSAGILRFPQYHYDMARLGIGLYGVNTLPPEMERPLATVSSLKTVIINLRDWPAGSSVGYARKGMLTRDSRIATIPIGYADGMSRHFGNGRIRVLVNDREAPTIGNICMDACMIDVTGIDCQVGDSVEIFGESAPVGRLSEALDTIPYEILTSISPRVKRVYFRE